MGLTNSTSRKRKGSIEQSVTSIILLFLSFFLSANDRSRSPVSQRDESPTRSTRPKESDFKFSNDQQVPSTDQSILRTPNDIALEKLEHIKQNLADLHEQVDAFSGGTRDDRVYKQLDEHAVNLMLRCDELTDVSADIKEKRKEMIQNVQTVVAKLESKVPINPLSSELNSNSNEIITSSSESPSSSSNNTSEQQQISAE